ncbi:MAG TPA: hypothetical protein VGP84_11210 [Gemmatimonadaceae bacterium]|nr:hypothetical protein [Gemmatimonadaceae bacterium]
MRNSLIRVLAGGWSVALVAAAPALAQRSVSRADLNGEWSGPIALDAGTQTLALVFRATDSTLAGTIYSDGAKFGDMEGLSLTGSTVHFKLDRLDFTGVIDGATMKVALIVYNGSTRNLTLKKVATPGGDSAATPPKPPRARS